MRRQTKFVSVFVVISYVERLNLGITVDMLAEGKVQDFYRESIQPGNFTEYLIDNDLKLCIL
jgi:hypothetical protein